MRSVIYTAGLGLLLLASGCAIPARTVTRTTEGRPIRVSELGDGPCTVLMIASIHGSEPAGTPLLEALYHHLKREPARLHERRVVFLMEANPDGLAAGTRTNAHGVDLNRNFPADNRRDSSRHGTALSEIESNVIGDLIASEEPALIVSIHQPFGVIDYDGPGEAIAGAMAAACDLPVKKLGARPGSLGAYAGECLGIPTITLELRKQDHTLARDELWRRYGEALLAAIDAAGQLSVRKRPAVFSQPMQASVIDTP